MRETFRCGIRLTIFFSVASLVDDFKLIDDRIDDLELVISLPVSVESDSDFELKCLVVPWAEVTLASLLEPPEDERVNLTSDSGDFFGLFGDTSVCMIAAKYMVNPSNVASGLGVDRK